MGNPTAEYDALNSAFSFFNKELFDSRLPSVLLTLRKHGGSYGYFRNGAFVNRVERNVATDEIALCANTFSGRTDREILSTLVHEMAHLWQSSLGKRKSKHGYHNLEWARRMLEVGLHPSDTGEPGGAMNGHRVTHYVIEGGPFDRNANELIASGWELKWEEKQPRVLTSGFLGRSTPAEGKQTRKKFICDRCRMAAWAKFTARLVCGTCGTAMS